jgi:hypothetical protein
MCDWIRILIAIDITIVAMTICVIILWDRIGRG